MNPKLPQAIEVVDEAEQQGLANLRCQAAPRSARRKLAFDHRENSFDLSALPIAVPRKSPAFLISERLVRKGGFEPPRLTAPPPQDGASASSATSARGMKTIRKSISPRPKTCQQPAARRAVATCSRAALPVARAEPEQRASRAGPGPQAPAPRSARARSRPARRSWWTRARSSPAR